MMSHLAIYACLLQVFASSECMAVIRGMYDEKRKLELKYKHFPPKVRGFVDALLKFLNMYRCDIHAR